MTAIARRFADEYHGQGRLIANVMASVAEWKREMGERRTSEALLAKRARGERIGRPQFLPDDTIRRIVAESSAGRKSPAIAEGLNADGGPTGRDVRSGGPLTVRAVLRSQAARRIELELWIRQ